MKDRVHSYLMKGPGLNPARLKYVKLSHCRVIKTTQSKGQKSTTLEMLAFEICYLCSCLSQVSSKVKSCSSYTDVR